MSAFIEEHRDRFGVEPICRTLGVSAPAYYQRASGQRSARAADDERLLRLIEQLHAANYHAYGYRRMWKALLRAGEPVGRDRVKRLMRANVWRTRSQLELAVVAYVAWFNNERLHEALGDIPPADFEADAAAAQRAQPA